MKHDDLIKAVQNVTATVTTLSDTVTTLSEAVKACIARLEANEEVLTGLVGLEGQLDELRTSIAAQFNEVLGTLNGYEEPEEGPPPDETDEQRATRVGLLARVGEIEALVKGRNRSAPVKRNMTDADALNCLIGEFKELDHKEAGEAMGLTYAQVYSCRLEYTFKHVHHKLRQSGAEVDGQIKPWKNPWAKK